jgi:hypothetical protein
VVRVRLAPAKDPGRRVQLAGVARSFNRGQASDQLLIEISAFGQGPAADAFKGFPPEREARVESTGGVVEVAAFKGTGTVPEPVPLNTGVLQVDIVVLPNDQNVPLCQTGKGVEFLRQRAEAT